MSSNNTTADKQKGVTEEKGEPIARARSLRTPNLRRTDKVRAFVQDRTSTTPPESSSAAEQRLQSRPVTRTKQSGSGDSVSGSFAKPMTEARTNTSTTPLARTSASKANGTGGGLSRSSSLSSRITPSTTKTPTASTRAPPSAWRPAASQSTANSTPSTRSVSNPKPSPSHVSRPSFSTYQKDFNVAASTSNSHSRSVSRASNSSATTTPRKTTRSGITGSHTRDNVSSSSNTVQIPLTTRLSLLHSSLLHQSASPTLKAYTKSAYSSLSARHSALQTLYTTVLTLRRSARQSRNLLALHNWTGGNIASLIRKLSVLAGVLGELCALTEPGSTISASHNNNKSIRRGNDLEEKSKDPGRYTACVAGFEAWIAWVREVWSIRDAPSSGLEDTETETQNKSVQIEGLGDGIKAEMKSLGNMLNGLMLKLEDLRNVRIPDVLTASAKSGIDSINVIPTPSKRGRKPAGEHESSADGASVNEEKTRDAEHRERPTPAILLDYAWTLAKGMQEEVQMMREIEFEVVVGEKAWMEEELRRLGEEVEGGWG